MILVSASPIFQGLREKVVIEKPEDVVSDKMAKWSKRNADVM